MKDWPKIWSMMERFAKKADLPYSLSESDCREVITHLMKHGYVAVSEGGFICGVITESPLNKNWIIAKEFLWWSEDGSGVDLFKGFRRWAKDNGANEIQMSCPEVDKVKRFYSLMGPKTENVYSEFV